MHLQIPGNVAVAMPVRGIKPFHNFRNQHFAPHDGASSTNTIAGQAKEANLIFNDLDLHIDTHKSINMFDLPDAKRYRDPTQAVRTYD